MVAWNRAGFAVSRGRQVWSIERQVRAIAGALVLIGVLGSLLLWQPLIYLGLLVGAGLLFAGLTDTCTPWRPCDVASVLARLTDRPDRQM